MNAALLCPGPSLSRTWSNDRRADLVIGVNRASAFSQCHYFAALDLPLILERGEEVKGSPSLLTRRETFDCLRRRGHAWSYRPTWLVEDLLRECPVPSWTLYTATASLVLAAHLQAERIDVYGADWTDEADFDGVRVESCRRTEERWAVERGIWAKLVDWLAGRGVEVIRHGAV